MNTDAAKHITLCYRCLGKGRYDRGACFECKRWGALGFTKRTTRRGRPAFVTAIRDAKEGRIAWVTIYGATVEQAIEITQRTMRVKGLPAQLIESVQAAT